MHQAHCTNRAPPLPWSRLGSPTMPPPPPPDGEGRVSLRASRLACRPALKNTGWPSRRSAAGTVAEEQDIDVEEEDEELTNPLRGGGGGRWLLAPRGGRAAWERQTVNGHEILEKMSGSDAAALPTSGWGVACRPARRRRGGVGGGGAFLW